MRAGLRGGSPSRIIGASRRREVLARSATTLCRTLHTSSSIRTDDAAPARPPSDLLSSRLQSAREFFRDQRAADSSAEVLMRRLSVRAVRHTVQSFNPETLSEADYVDLSGHTCQLNVARRYSRLPTVIPYRYQPFTAFLPGTAGFFYYISSPALPAAGEIRFRITGSPRPESFPLGRDLLTWNGLVWRLHLLTMVKGFDEYAPLVAKLRSEGLVTDETMNACQKLTRRIAILSNTERALHSFYQPFIFDFKNRKPKSLWFLTRHVLDKVTLEEWLTQNGKYTLPTSGTVMLCAEPRTTRKDESSRGVVLRVLKIVRPVMYPKRSTLYSAEDVGAEGDGSGPDATPPPPPPPRARDASDRILRAYEGQLLSNSLGEPLVYVPNAQDWPSFTSSVKTGDRQED